MSKFRSWEPDIEAKGIAVSLIEKYPQLFRHVDVEKVFFIRNQCKKSKVPTKITSVKYPYDIFCTHTYIIEIFDDCWGTLEKAQRNLAIAQSLFAIHVSGFEENSTCYGKIVKPDIVTYLEVTCMAGNVPNWLGNVSASDPLAE